MKSVRVPLLTAIVAAVLCAGTVSAHQLSLASTTTMCRGFCTRSGGCPNVLGCGCVFNNPGATVGVCNFISAKPAH